MESHNNEREDECNCREEYRLSYIFYYPEGKYVFNRSVDLSSQPYRKYMRVLDEFGNNTLQSKYKEIVDRQMSMDFILFELLEVVHVENRCNRDQAFLNERKQYWCEEKHAIWNTSDKTIDVEADKIIQRNVTVALDEIFGQMAAVLYPFVKEEYILDMDPGVKEYYKLLKMSKRYRDIHNYLEDTHILDARCRTSLNSVRKYEDEIKRLKLEKDLLEDEISNMYTENPDIKERFIRGVGQIVKPVRWSSKQCFCIISALRHCHGFSVDGVIEYMGVWVDVVDNPDYIDGDNIIDVYEKTKTSSLKIIRTGCDILDSFTERGFIQ